MLTLHSDNLTWANLYLPFLMARRDLMSHFESDSHTRHGCIFFYLFLYFALPLCCRFMFKLYQVSIFQIVCIRMKQNGCEVHTSILLLFKMKMLLNLFSFPAKKNRNFNATGQFFQVTACKS